MKFGDPAKSESVVNTQERGCNSDIVIALLPLFNQTHTVLV